MRKRRAEILKSAGIIGLCSLPVAVLLLSLRWAGLLQPFEWVAYDWFFQLRSLEPVDERIVIVGMTESDIRLLGHPISDRDLAQLIEKIQAYNPRLIGLDLVRDRPVEKGIEELNEVFATTSNLIGVAKIVGETDETISPPPVLSKKRQVASVDVTVDRDGVTRRGFFVIKGTNDNRVYFHSLGSQLAIEYLKKEGINPTLTPDKKGTQIGKVSLYPLQKNDGGYQNIDAWDFQFLVNFRNPVQSFKKVSFSQVLTGEIEAHFFQNKIVIIGMTAVSIKDEFYTPYSHSLNHPPKLIHGIEVQANFASHILSAVLDGRPIIKTIPDEAEVAFILFWGLGTAIAIRLVHSLKNYVILFGVIFGIVTGLIVFLLVGSWTAFLQGWWLPFVPSVFLISGTSILSYCLILQEKNQELESLQEQIIEERKQTALSTLAAGIAHEIRNPLLHILNFTHLNFEYLEEIQEDLKKPRPDFIAESDEEVEKLIEIAKRNSKETITQIERIKQISELLSSVTRRGSPEPSSSSLSLVGISKPTLVNLNNLLDSILKIASYSRQFEKEDFCINLETNYDLTIGEKKILVEDFTKIFINLINNACDAVLEKREKKGEEFHPTIGVATQLLDEHFLKITVWDNGEGISPLIASTIYEPFATTKSAKQGTGLGLYITYDLVKKNGGQICWERVAGVTQFIVLFPIPESDQENGSH
jgi:CHASE2 domain-containing sensor protein